MPQPSLVTMFHSISLAVRELHSASPPLAHRDIKVETEFVIQNPKSIIQCFRFSLTIFYLTET